VIELQSLSKQQSFGPDQSEDTQRAFFCAALDRSLTAELKAGIIERFFALGGCVLNLKFAGDMLARCFVPALAHLEVPPTSCPDAVIHIWDSESTGTDGPNSCGATPSARCAAAGAKMSRPWNVDESDSRMNHVSASS